MSKICIVLSFVVSFFRTLQALKIRLYQRRHRHRPHRRCRRRHPLNSVCHRQPAAVSTNPKNAHTADAHSPVIIH